MRATIVFNGKRYNDAGEMPEADRHEYERAIRGLAPLMADADRMTEHLTQIEQRLRARGLPELSQDTVQTLVEVMTSHGLDTQPLDYDQIANQVMEAMGAQQASRRIGQVGDETFIRQPVGTMSRPGPFGQLTHPVLNPTAIGGFGGLAPRVPGGRLPTDQLLRT